MTSEDLEPGAPENVHVAVVDGYAGLCKVWSCDIKAMASYLSTNHPLPFPGPIGPGECNLCTSGYRPPSRLVPRLCA